MKANKFKSCILQTIDQLSISDHIAALKKEIDVRKAAQAERMEWLNTSANLCKLNYSEVARFVRVEDDEIYKMELELAEITRRAKK